MYLFCFPQDNKCLSLQTCEKTQWQRRQASILCGLVCHDRYMEKEKYTTESKTVFGHLLRLKGEKNTFCFANWICKNYYTASFISLCLLKCYPALYDVILGAVNEPGHWLFSASFLIQTFSITYIQRMKFDWNCETEQPSLFPLNYTHPWT